MKQKIIWLIFVALSSVVSIITNQITVSKFGGEGVVMLGVATNIIALIYLWGSLSSETGLLRALVINQNSKNSYINGLFFLLTPMVGILGYTISTVIQSTALVNLNYLVVTALFSSIFIAYIKAKMVTENRQHLKALVDLCIALNFLLAVFLLTDIEKILPTVVINYVIICVTIISIYYFFNFKGFEIKLSFNNLISDLREALHLYRYSFHSLVSGFLAINLILLTREAIEKAEGIDFTAIFESHYRSILWVSTIMTLIFSNYIFPEIVRYTLRSKKKILDAIKFLVFVLSPIYLILSFSMAYLIFYFVFSKHIQFNFSFLLLFAGYEMLKMAGQFLSAALLGMGLPTWAMSAEILLYFPALLLAFAILNFSIFNYFWLIVCILFMGVIYVAFLIILNLIADARATAQLGKNNEQ